MASGPRKLSTAPQVSTASWIDDCRTMTAKVLVTGFDEGWTGERIRRMGIRELLAKPFTVSELAEVVARQLGPSGE